MTDRHTGYLVTLTRDIREDDAEEGVLNAIRMIRGVMDVRPITAEPSAQAIEIRAGRAWRDALLTLVRNGPGGSESES